MIGSYFTQDFLDTRCPWKVLSTRHTQSLDRFQEFVMVPMKVQLNVPFQELTYRFTTSVSTVSRIFLARIRWCWMPSCSLSFIGKKGSNYGTPCQCVSVAHSGKEWLWSLSSTNLLATDISTLSSTARMPLMSDNSPVSTSKELPYENWW